MNNMNLGYKAQSSAKGFNYNEMLSHFSKTKFKEFILRKAEILGCTVNYHMMNAHIDVTERFLKQSIPIFKNIFNLYDTTVLEKTIEHRIVELSLLKDDSNYYFLRAFNKHIHRGELKINHSTCQILHKIALDYQPLNKPLKLSQNLIEILDASYDTLSAHKISSIDLINKNNNINKNHKFKKI